jgi:hypothetical protein
LLGIGFTALGVRHALSPSNLGARRVMLASFFYLPALLALLAYDKV